MWRFFSVFFILLFIFGCSGASPEPVNLPIPFAGALDNTSNVVIANGNPVGGNSSLSLSQKSIKNQSTSGCTEFSTFATNGPLVGTAAYCPSSTVTNLDVGGDRQDSFTMEVKIDNGSGNTVSGTVQFFDYPHVDEAITNQIPVILPDVDPATVELRKGVCLGVITSGSGNFTNASNNATMDCRYVALSRVDNNQKIFLNLLESVWILHGSTGSTMGADTQESEILATLFENGFSFSRDDGATFGFPLFSEGNVDNPMGFVEYSDLQPLEATPQKVDLLATVKLCKGSSCVCNQTGCTCAEPSCITVHNARYISLSVPQITDLFSDGIPFSATMTEHEPPVDCSGDFFAGCSDNSLKLDYRCQPVISLGENGMVNVIRSLSGAYVITN